jgi:hypothetical protein
VFAKERLKEWRQGTVLDALYLQSRKKPTAADLAGARALAQITGKRLAAT